MRLDDYTEGRFAEFPSGATSTVIPVRSMLLGLNGIWSDTDAAELLIDDSDRDKLGLGSEPWTGAGGPRTLRAYSPTAGGQGEYRTSDRYNARILTFPLIENTHNKAEKNKLLGLMWPSTVLVGGLPYKKLLAAGFRRDTQANSRYLLDVSDEGSFDKQYRGVEDLAMSPVKVKSTWPWYVTPRTATDNSAFTPAGEGSDVLWGCYWSGSVGTVTIAMTGGGRSVLASFPAPSGGSFASPFFCFSPPFKTAPSGAYSTSRVPPYLQTGQSYTINISPAGGQIFYLRIMGVYDGSTAALFAVSALGESAAV